MPPRLERGSLPEMSGEAAFFLPWAAQRPAALTRPPAWRPGSQATGDIMPQAECRRTVLYSSIQAATRTRAAALVAKCSRRRSSNSTVECHDSMTALSRVVNYA